MSKNPTKKQKERWERIRDNGCSICTLPPAIHHCLTGMGGRKDHDKVIGLCHYHHQGDEGIHTLGRKVWQEKYGTEQYHMEKAPR